MEGLKSHMATVPNPWIYPKYPKVAIVTSYLSFLLLSYAFNACICKCLCGTVLSLKNISI